MTDVLIDPKWPPLAQRHGFTWRDMTDRDKVHFISVVEYNKDRQQLLDADPEIVSMTARIAESSQVSSMLLQRLQDLKDAATKHLASAQQRELDMLKDLQLPLDPPRLVHNPNTGDYDVMFCDTSHLHLTAKEAVTPDGREQIKLKLAELEEQRTQ
jgi:hypothetical protein